MAITTTGNIQKLLVPGLTDIFGLKYNSLDQNSEWRQLFTIQNSVRSYEEDEAITGLGLANRTAEGDSVQYDSFKQAYTVRYTSIKYTLGFILTEEAIDDNLYVQSGMNRAQALARSIHETQEITAANVFNHAFNGSYPGGDSVSFLNASHPTESGVQSNVLSVAADLSEASLENILIQIEDARDNRNLRINIKPQKLIIPKWLMFDATRILKNPQRPGTADRDINALYALDSLPGGMVINRYFTDQDAWFVMTDCEPGLKYINRKWPMFGADNDFDTSNAKFKVNGRWAVGFTDWRCMYGSEGA